jgi:hypothetical protein
MAVKIGLPIVGLLTGLNAAACSAPPRLDYEWLPAAKHCALPLHPSRAAAPGKAAGRSQPLRIFFRGVNPFTNNSLRGFLSFDMHGNISGHRVFLGVSGSMDSDLRPYSGGNAIPAIAFAFSSPIGCRSPENTVRKAIEKMANEPTGLFITKHLRLKTNQERTKNEPKTNRKRTENEPMPPPPFLSHFVVHGQVVIQGFRQAAWAGVSGCGANDEADSQGRLSPSPPNRQAGPGRGKGIAESQRYLDAAPNAAGSHGRPRPT